MMRTNGILLILLPLSLNLFNVATAKDSTCLNSCGDHGTCNSGNCTCYLFYEGDDCSIRWREDNDWFIVWNITIAISLLTMFCGFVIIVRYIVLNFSRMRTIPISEWPVSYYMLVLGIIGTLLRLIVFAIDPFSERNIWPASVSAPLYVIPMIIGVWALDMLFLFWWELQDKTHKPNLTRTRNLFLVFVIVSLLLTIPFVVAGTALNSQILLNVYNIAFAMITICSIGLLVYAGLTLIKLVRNVESFGQAHGEYDANLHKFLIRLTLHVVASIYLAVSIGIMTILYVALNSREHKWKFVIFQILFRTHEALFLAAVYVVLQRDAKERGEGSPISKHSYSGSSSVGLRTIDTA